MLKILSFHSDSYSTISISFKQVKEHGSSSLSGVVRIIQGD